ALPRDFRMALPHILDNSAQRGFIVESDADGRFAFAAAPNLDGATLCASLAGFERYEEPAPSTSMRALAIVLRRPRARPGMIAGQVVDERGRPTPDARVSLGHGALTA